MKTFTKLAAALVLAVSLIPVSNSALATSDDKTFSQAQLEQMLAPIALYPDTLLSHILIAATYPLDVVQAARWWQSNRDLIGAAAVAAVEHEDWDPSVKALVAFPEIIARMNQDLQWTQNLGDAFLQDQAGVLSSIQTLREQAYAAGNLDSLEHFRIVREPHTIVIEAAQPQLIYVPVYDTRVVFGNWRWHSYPPVYWDYSHYPHHGPIRHAHTGGHVQGFYWGVGIPVSAGFFFSSFQWHSGKVVVIKRSSWPHVFSGKQIAHHRDAHPWQHRGIYDRDFTRRPLQFNQGPDRQYHVRYGRPSLGDRFRDTRQRNQWTGGNPGNHLQPGHGVEPREPEHRRLIPQRDLLPPAGVLQRGPRAGTREHTTAGRSGHRQAESLPARRSESRHVRGHNILNRR